MPVCGACNEVIVDAEGNERPEARIPHACRSCKKPLHSYLHESCNVHMPEDGEYFCNEQCEANLTFGGNSSSSPSESESMHPSPVRREDDAWDDENITIAQLMDAATASRRRGVVVPTGATREEAELAPVTEEPPAPAPIAAPVTEEPRAPALVAAPVRVDDDKLEDGSKLSLTDVVAVGARVAMSYMTVDGDKSSGKWWHGYVASYENDIATIGFDDADLERFHTKELQGLFEMEKLVVAKEGATGGRVSSEETHLRATGVCCMKHGEKQYPVGVFLQDMLCLDKLCSQPIYHSHIIAPQALEEALADIKGTRTTRGKSADNSKSELSGYKTFKHGAYATYHDTEDGVNRTYEEVVLGVMCFQFRDALRLGHIVNQKLLGRPAAEAIGIGASLVTWG
ncbi:hypothetical protein AB1Y20_021011 [Prymnesium parvum]|uniref:Uncharacterized protein n=1 Tax=Prymnesium parvum TaxID=97485 RepID=A0AB34JIG1_PRYPA